MAVSVGHCQLNNSNSKAQANRLAWAWFISYRSAFNKRWLEVFIFILLFYLANRGKKEISILSFK